MAARFLIVAVLAGCNTLVGTGELRVSPEPCAVALAACSATSIPVIGDWDGDGKQTPGLFDRGRWCVTNLRAQVPVCIDFKWGADGDTPIVGDWNGDGISSPGWYNNTRWSLKDADDRGNPADFGWGNPTMQPLAGDWDHHGRDTPGGTHDVSGLLFWGLSNHNSGGGIDHSFTWGAAGRTPLVGDWDGNGTDTPAWYQDGVWTFSNVNAMTGTAATFTWGAAGDIPIVGDWDGDGFDTVGLYHEGDWSLLDTHVDVLDGTVPTGYSTFHWGTP